MPHRIYRSHGTPLLRYIGTQLAELYRLSCSHHCPPGRSSRTSCTPAPAAPHEEIEAAEEGAAAEEEDEGQEGAALPAAAAAAAAIAAAAMTAEREEEGAADDEE